MCWYAHSSNNVFLIRTALEKNHDNLVGLCRMVGALRLVSYSTRQEKPVSAVRFNNLGVFFLFSVAFETFTP